MSLPNDMTDAEKLARMMCAADGFLPDTLVTRQVMAVGPKGSAVLPHQDNIVYAWTLYEWQARALIDQGVTVP